ncbi:MAG: DUF721 domain-containing protein [Candidatus Omnitrophica bacterium]|nr:DUF721 domain-containing protein [Candidatus Omnitrophota bacterium]
MTRRKTNRRPEDIKKILDKLIGKIGKAGPGKKDRILAAWKKVVGEKAATHSRPVSIKRKVMTIEIDSSTWMYELNLKKKHILGDVKKHLGEDKVKDLRFRMGNIT